jgi:hypothetical protein
MDVSDRETESEAGGSNHVTSLASSLEEHDEPLMIAATKGSYNELLRVLREIDFDSQGSSSRVLPPELSVRVLEYLVIEPVSATEVQVVGCSSHDGVHPLKACLSDDDTTWWMAAESSMPLGRGNEHVELLMGPTLRRVKAIAIKIPPLPQGPLSVREFRLDAPANNGEWKAISSVFTLDNRLGFQRFLLADEMDAKQVRLVCLSNQISTHIDGPGPGGMRRRGTAEHPATRRFETVGFFTVTVE